MNKLNEPIPAKGWTDEQREEFQELISSTNAMVLIASKGNIWIDQDAENETVQLTGTEKGKKYLEEEGNDTFSKDQAHGLAKMMKNFGYEYKETQDGLTGAVANIMMLVMFFQGSLDLETSKSFASNIKNIIFEDHE